MILIRWQLAYPGAALPAWPDNPLGLDDADESGLDDNITDRLNIPVDKPVLVLSSKDVIRTGQWASPVPNYVAWATTA